MRYFVIAVILALAQPTYAQSTLAADLHARINASCPITGVSIGTPSDKATWTFTPQAGATAGQISAGQSVITTFSLAPYTAANQRRYRFRLQLYQARNALDAIQEELSNDPGNADITADIAAVQAQVAALRAAAKQ